MPVFDGVRGIAILAVIMYHTGSIAGGGGGVDRVVGHVTGAGWLGVDLFFVLSGFLITGILLDTKGDQGYFRSFYARRTLRIFPLFYAVVVVAVIAIPLAFALGLAPDRLRHYSDDLWGNQLWLWTYTHNYLQASEPHTLPGLGHMWSLAIEEQFYLVWPLAVYLTPRRRLLPLIVVVCAAVFVLRTGLAQSGTDPWALRHWTFTRIDTLLFGAMAAVIVRTPTVWARVRPVVLPLAVSIGTLLVGNTVLTGPLRLDSAASAMLVYPMAAVGCAALIVWLCSSSAKPLEAAWLRKVGFYSYAMYVFHWPINQAFVSLWRRTGVTEALTGGTALPLVLLQFAVVTAAAFVAAVISWKLWEERWLRLKDRFAYREASKA